MEITVLKEGMSFGELALNSGQPRAATIICKSDCHFAVMSKADYEKCLLSIAKKNMQLALDFLRSLPFIGNTITRTQLVKMKLQMEQKTFRRL
jgi:CRP-like cAMP-binding protein